MNCSLRRAAAVALVVFPACFDPEAPDIGTEASTGAEGGSTTGSVVPGTTAVDVTTAEGTTASASEGSTSTTASVDSGSSSGSSSSESSSTTGPAACDPGEFGPECAPCNCVNGTCDEGLEGTGACTCAMGWTGSACDWDCGPGGELQGDGSCRTVLLVLEDAFVCSGDWAAQNHGFDDFTLRAIGQQNDFTGNQIGRAFYKLDLGVLPPGIGLTEAWFHVKEYDNFAGFPTTVQLRPAPSAWTEANVTWNNQPAVPATVLGTANVGCCGQAHQIEVTSAVQTALDNGLTELSFQLRGDDETVIGGVRWFFREGDGVNLGGIVGAPPRLELLYTVP